MPVYEVTAPDGRVFEVTAPDGATQEQVMAYAQKNFQPAQRTVMSPAQSRQALMEKEAAYVEPPEVADMSAMERAAAGFGRRFANTGMGISQRLGNVSAADVDERRKLDSALLGTTAGKVGDFLGSVAQVAPTSAIKGANTLAGAAGIGALFGLVQPTGTGESAGENALVGGALGAAGQGAANLLGRAVKPVRGPGLNAEELRLAELAKQKGIQLTPAQLTQSRPLQALESTMLDMPFTSGPQQAVRQSQNQAWNRAIAQAFGENADDLTPQVMGAAKSRIGNQIGDIAARNALDTSESFVDKLANVQSMATRYETSDVSRILNNYIDDFMSKVDQSGKVPGLAYRKLDSSIGKRMRETSNGDLKNALGQLRGVLREGMDQSISAADKEAWNIARKQYANMKTVERAIKPDASGEVFPARLANAVKRNDVDAFIYGRPGNELVDLSKIGTSFIRDNVPNSGTAQRQYWRDFLNGSLITQGVMLGKGAVGATAGRAAQSVMNSPAGRAYLTNGLLGNMTDSALSAGNAVRPFINPLLIPSGYLGQ